MILSVHVSTYAVKIDKTREDLQFPKSPTVQQENLMLPDSIYIVPIRPKFDEYTSITDLYKGIYYYQAFRLNQGDFLFHYLVTRDGELIQGNNIGEEQRFAFKDISDKPVVIAYIAEKNEDDFTNSGKDKLNEILIDIANRHRIKLENIFIKGLSYKVTEQQQIVGTTDIVAGRWERSLKTMISEITDKYDPARFRFELSVTSVKSPVKSANYRDQVVAEITIQNNSAISLYEGSDFEPILTKEGSDSFSKFFINGIWLGPTQAKVMTEGSSIKPGESKTFQVKLGAPLYEGKQVEKFSLVSVLGDKYKDTTFELEVNVNKIDGEVIEVAYTSVGYLNVREAPNTTSNVVTKVSPGQRFLVLERQSSWVKIDTIENGQGWVSAEFTKKV